MDDSTLPLPPRGLALRTLLVAAGEAALEAFARGGAVRRKVDGSPVTDADLAAEKVLIEGIRARWPEDGLLSEEAGEVADGGDARWIIDPIDGTSAFVEGLAHWGPVAARVVLSQRGTHVDCGAIWLPRLAEHYHVEGGAAWFNGARMPRVTHAPRVLYLPSEFHRQGRLDWDGKTRGLGGTAAHLALVARGAAQAVIVGPGWAPWDTAAGLSLIDVTGGRALRFPTGSHTATAEGVDPFRDVGAAFVAGMPDVVEELVLGGRVDLHFKRGANGP